MQTSLRQRFKRAFAFTVIFGFIFGLFSVGSGGYTVRAADDFSVSVTQLIFSRALPEGASPAKSVTVQNTSGGTLNFTVNKTGSGEFALSGGTSFSLGSGETQNLSITFDPSSNGVKVGNLAISDGSETENVELRGLGFNNSSGSTNEPSLQRIIDTFGYSINVGDNDPSSVKINDTNGGTSGMLGQETPLQRLQKAGGGNVTIQVLAAFAVNSSPVARVGYYPIGNPGDKNEVFTVNNGSHQTLLPATSGSLSFNPGDGGFGLYSIWPSFGNRNVYSEDALNTFHITNPHKMRFYPLGGNRYIATVEEYNDGNQAFSYDYNDVVYIISNVKPYTVGGSPSLRLENLQWSNLLARNIPNTGWMNTWMTFARINAKVTAHKQADRQIMRVHNDGGGLLNINSIQMSNGAWFKVNGVTSGISIPGGSFHDIEVQFIASGGAKGQRKATMTLNTNAGSRVIDLSGGYQAEPEGNFEYFTPETAKIFGFKTNIGNIPGGRWEAAGEEVMSKRWKVANAGQPIYVRQLAALHQCCFYSEYIRLNWGGGGGSDELRHHQDWSQTLLPIKPDNQGGGTAEMLVSSKGNGIFTPVVGYNQELQQHYQSCSDVCDNLHGIRWWPARDKDGAIIPNTYLVAQDYVAQDITNYDYNDNIYLVTNVMPADPLPTDIQVTSTIPGTVKVNRTRDFNLAVRNNDLTSTTEDVVLTVTLPSNITYNSNNGGCTTAPGAGGAVVLTCVLGDFAPQQSRNIAVNVTPSVVGVVNTEASLAATTKDWKPANNALSIRVRVQEQAIPVAVNDSYDVVQDNALVAKIVNGVLANDTDGNNDPLTAELQTGVAPDKGVLALNADGSLIFTPAPGFVGNASFTYKARDDEAPSTNTATVTIRVLRKPPTTLADSYALDEDGALNTPAANGVLANDTGYGGATLKAVLVTGPAHAASFQLRPNGSFDYAPQAHFNGADSFTYRADDGDNLSAVTTVTLTIAPVPDAPVATDDAYSVEVNDSIVVNAASGVLANDFHPDAKPLTVALLTGPQYGALTLNANGSFTYTSGAAASADSFTYQVNDGSGGTASAEVALTILPVLGVPVTGGDSYTAYRDTPLNVNAADGVLGNDAAAGGATLTAELLANPDGLDLTLNPNGSFVYNPAPGFVGTVGFSYRATATGGATAINSATITVVEADAPVQLLENGGFETLVKPKNLLPTKWTAARRGNDRIRCNTPKVTVASEGMCAYRFVGDKVSNSQLYQQPDPANIGAGMTLTLLATVEGRNVIENAARLVLQVQYADKTKPSKAVIVLPPGTYGYTAFSANVETLGPVAQIRVTASYNARGKTGNFTLDDVRLLLTEGGAGEPLGANVASSPSSAIPLPAAADLRGGN